MNRWRFLRAVVGLAFFVGAMMLTSACETTSTPSSTTSSSYTIGGVVFGTDVFFQLVRIGMQDAANHDHVKLLLNNSTYDSSKEASLIQQYVAAGVNAMAISPVSQQTSAQNLKPAIDKGIAISCYNTCISSVKAFVHSSDYDLGMQTGKLAAQYIQAHGPATIGILTCDKLYPACLSRRQGFFDQLKGLTYQLVAEQQSFEANDAVNVASTMLQAHSQINFLWAENEGGTVGEVRAVKTANKSGKVVVFGTDASVQLAQFLQDQDNILQATTGKDAYTIGYDALQQAVDLLQKKTTGQDIATKSIVLDRANPAAVSSFIANQKKYGVS